MHQLASQSRDPITKAVATNIVGVQRHGQATGKEKYYFKITASVNVYHIVATNTSNIT